MDYLGRYAIVWLSLVLGAGCSSGGEEKTPAKASSSDNAEEDSSTDSPVAQQVDTSVQDGATNALPAGCSQDGHLCLIVSFSETDGLWVKAVLKNGASLDTEAQGSVVFSFASFHDGVVEEFFDAAGEYRDDLDADSESNIAVDVVDGEAVLYDRDTAVSFPEFKVNTHDSFVLKASYGAGAEAKTATLKACHIDSDIAGC